MFYVEHCNSLGYYVIADAARNSMHSNGKIYCGCYEYFPTPEDAQAVLDKFQPKHEWKHGDIAITPGGTQRLFIEIKGELRIFNLCGGYEFNFGGDTADKWAADFNYVYVNNMFED